MKINKLLFKFIIYIVCLFIILFSLSLYVMKYTQKISNISKSIYSNSEISKFDLYMLKTIKTNNTIVRKIGIVEDDESSYFITFQKDDGTTFSFIKINDVLYYNQIKLCENVDFFRVIMDKSEKESINVDIIIDGKTYNLQYSIS